jgi:SAM-dependent methyltransferase
MTQTDIHYPASFTERLEILWGEGFLSPGGAEEVKQILKGIDLADKAVLDIGCGTGGVEMVMARELDVGHVLGIDIEPQLIEICNQRITDAELEHKAEVRLVEPGPLDFADNSFDLIFSKDSLVHIPDKAAIFEEIFRVLKPGGIFAASDWLVSDNADNFPEMATYREVANLEFEFATAAETSVLLEKAGFSQVTTVDRNDWYAPLANYELEQLEGPLRQHILEVIDDEAYQYWMEVRRALRDVTKVGALRPTHLRGSKPLNGYMN